MKKSLIITIGIVLIILVLAVWLYLLFFGTPENTDDVFTDLGFGGAARPVDTTPNEGTEPDDTVVELGTPENPLQQLTTRPVAGFAFVGTSTSLIRYVERGTGHIFEINIDDRSEKRISGTTIPRVVEAVFSFNGESVALITENGYVRTVFAGVIPNDTSNIDYLTLPQNAFAPDFINTNKLQYAVKTDGGTDGFEIDVRNNDPVRTFSIPFRDITIIWDENAYAYNKPTQHFKGTLYRVGNTLTAITPGEFGFVGGLNETHILGTAVINEEFASYAVNRAGGERVSLPITYIPEKCDFVPADSNTLWCAASFGALGKDKLEAWYQGAENHEDALWRVNIQAGEAELVSDLLEESGRLVDVDSMTTDALGRTPIFRNKIDNTLWLYDTRIQ